MAIGKALTSGEGSEKRGQKRARLESVVAQAGRREAAARYACPTGCHAAQARDLARIAIGAAAVEEAQTGFGAAREERGAGPGAIEIRRRKRGN